MRSSARCERQRECKAGLCHWGERGDASRHGGMVGRLGAGRVSCADVRRGAERAQAAKQLSPFTTATSSPQRRSPHLRMRAPWQCCKSCTPPGWRSRRRGTAGAAHPAVAGAGIRGRQRWSSGRCGRLRQWQGTAVAGPPVVVLTGQRQRGGVAGQCRVGCSVQPEACAAAFPDPRWARAAAAARALQPASSSSCSMSLIAAAVCTRTGALKSTGSCHTPCS